MMRNNTIFCIVLCNDYFLCVISTMNYIIILEWALRDVLTFHQLLQCLMQVTQLQAYFLDLWRS